MKAVRWHDRLEAVGFINVTRQCNVDCKRCYLTEAHRTARERLQPATLERFLDHQFWQDRPVTLIWEGGEVAVVGAEAMQLYCESARRTLPGARQTMVTNCFSVPDWLVELSRTQFEGTAETTYAAGHKYSLAGDSEHYQRKFFVGLNKFWRAGVQCPVNVELNIETIHAGADALAAAMLNSECRVWEFDVSVDFRSFLANPVYSLDSVPHLPLTASYAQGWEFIARLRDGWGNRLAAEGIAIGAFERLPEQSNNQFNVACENRFLTLNPDGMVTTNPLYSDLEGTFLGNVNDDGLDPILANRKRIMRILADRKRASACKSCDHFTYCKGGPSHVPVADGSGECAGGKGMWAKLLEKPRA